jgi:hypothetical protein
MTTHPCHGHLDSCDHCYLCDVVGVCCASVPPPVRADLHTVLDRPGSLDVLRDCLTQLAGGAPVSGLRRRHAELVASRLADREQAMVRLVHRCLPAATADPGPLPDGSSRAQSLADARTVTASPATVERTGHGVA